MSSDTDRIPVPTNGRGPHPAPDRATQPLETDPVEPTSAEFSVAFSPKQVAVGFGIIASLILLLVGARRRRPGR